MENKSETLTAVRLFELADLFGVDPRHLLHGDDVDRLPEQILARIGEIVLLVETSVQEMEVRPAPELVRDAVLEVLKQEANQTIEAQNQPLDTMRYQGLIRLIFKSAKDQ